MAGKKEFSAVVVKAFKSFPRYFRCLTASPDRALGFRSWRGTSMVRGLISEPSYPWAAEPAGLNGSIRLSGKSSGDEREPCLRWRSSWSDRRRQRRKTDAGQCRIEVSSVSAAMKRILPPRGGAKVPRGRERSQCALQRDVGRPTDDGCHLRIGRAGGGGPGKELTCGAEAGPHDYLQHFSMDRMKTE